MGIEHLQYARHPLVSIIGPTMFGPREKILKIKIVRWLENAT